MNFTSKYHQNLITEFTDVELILQDSIKIIKLKLHKIILSYASEYFYKLFSFNKHKSNYTMVVLDADLIESIIMSFYGLQSVPHNYPEWEYTLKMFKCRDYLCLPNDITKLYDLIVPIE